jgi:hypothetical protein
MTIQNVARTFTGRRAGLQSDREARIAERSHLQLVQEVEAAAARARYNRDLAHRVA